MKKINLIYLLLIFILSSLIFICYTLGIANISFLDSLKVLGSRISFVSNYIDISGISKNHLIILLDIRLPRVLTAVLVGACLSVVGAVFQGLFRNPLAEPYVLGISSGASLGATIAIVFSLSSISLLASCFAVVTVLLVLFVANFKGRSSTLLLTGISISFFCSSFSSLLMALVPDKVKTIVFWSMGSFSTSSNENLLSILPLCVLGLLFTFALSREINAISIGEDDAKGFGIDVKKFELIIILVSTIIIALCVSVSGIIGFVGLIVPNALRLVVGSDYKKLIPSSALCGGIFLLICDTVARTIFSPIEIPVGSITAFIGAPFFVFLILRRQKNA